jgi:hypothetical protein
MAMEFLGDVLHVPLALGTLSKVEATISDALEEPHSEALSCVQRAQVKHLDATSWSRSGEPSTLWTFACRLVTVFVITANATTQTVRGLVGAVRGTLVTDRASVFGFWAMERKRPGRGDSSRYHWGMTEPILLAWTRSSRDRRAA